MTRRLTVSFVFDLTDEGLLRERADAAVAEHGGGYEPDAMSAFPLADRVSELLLGSNPHAMPGGCLSFGVELVRIELDEQELTGPVFTV